MNSAYSKNKIKAKKFKLGCYYRNLYGNIVFCKLMTPDQVTWVCIAQVTPLYKWRNHFPHEAMRM
jgi:hypothetical protein